MRMTMSICFLLSLLAVPYGAQALTIAANGIPNSSIIVADQASRAELTAARELADYLGQITGATFSVQQESARTPYGGNIYIGHTRASIKAGLASTGIGPEEWVISSHGSDLILTGGRPRGTLYAAYHFLEDVLSVHWWNPWEESVPRRTTLKVDSLSLRGKPFFNYRDIYMLYGNDGGRFAVRNRLNRDGDAAIDSRYGGSMAYGPPYHVHTFSLYFPPKQYFAVHPEWYSLIDGKRTGDNSQLCLTSPELRKAFLSKLISFIENSRAQAKVAELPPPLVFSISQNDNRNHCQCDRCRVIAQAERSEAGPLLDFVNFLAGSIRIKYPGVMIDTLAYQDTRKPPSSIRPLDNVIVRVCDTDSDLLRTIEDPINVPFREDLLAWSRITKNLRVWKYGVTYVSPTGMPLPTLPTYQPDFQYFATHHVEGIFTEFEYPVLADMRDLKVWMIMKLLENPFADARNLQKTFIGGFYGPAAPMILQYLEDLQREAAGRGSRATTVATPDQLDYLDADFVVRAQALFDSAEQAVGSDALLLRRVRHARLPLDRASAALFTKLQVEWRSAGGTARFPLERGRLAARAFQTWNEQTDLRLTGNLKTEEKRQAGAELGRHTPRTTTRFLPEKFRHLPPDRVFDYTPETTRNWQNIVLVVPDHEAESGKANFLDLTAPNVEQAEKYVLPMVWGLYDTKTKEGLSGRLVFAEDISGPGYHWYKLGTFTIGPNHYLYFFWSWIIQLDVFDLYDAARPDRQFEVWARIKFTGPRFPHARPGEKDGIYVERVVFLATD